MTEQHLARFFTTCTLLGILPPFRMMRPTISRYLCQSRITFPFSSWLFVLSFQLFKERTPSIKIGGLPLSGVSPLDITNIQPISEVSKR